MARHNFSDSAHACVAQTGSTSLEQPVYLARSIGFITVATILYASAVIASWLTAWPVRYILLLDLLLILDFLRVTITHGLRNATQSVSNLRKVCGKWYYQLNSGKCYKASLVRQNSFCSAWLLILCLRHMTGRRYVLIPRDAVSLRAYRLLAFQINHYLRKTEGHVTG